MSKPADGSAAARARRRALGCLPALFLWSVGSAAAEEPDLAWLDSAALANGAVQVLADRDERPLTVHIWLAALVAAPPEAIWDVLVACEIAPEYVPNVTSCRSLEVIAEGKAELFIQTVKPAFFLPTFEHVFRLDYEPYRRIDVHRVSGPIEHMEGTWWLLPQDDGKILLVYELSLDPGIPMPRFLVRATLKRDLPRLVEAVRQRAQAQP
jgi:ribosome-associated toxin RatA of RatAB toxin-antitoxin module